MGRLQRKATMRSTPARAGHGSLIPRLCSTYTNSTRVSFLHNTVAVCCTDYSMCLPNCDRDVTIVDVFDDILWRLPRSWWSVQYLVLGEITGVLGHSSRTGGFRTKMAERIFSPSPTRKIAAPPLLLALMHSLFIPNSQLATLLRKNTLQGISALPSWTLCHHSNGMYST